MAMSPFQSHLKFVLSSWYSGRFLQSCYIPVCHMAILVNPTRSILFAHCALDVALSPSLFPALWLPFASFLIHLLSCVGFCFLAAIWDYFFSFDFKLAGVALRFFSQPAPNHPILRLAQRDIVVYCENPEGRSLMITNAIKPLTEFQRESLLGCAGCASIWMWCVISL